MDRRRRLLTLRNFDSARGLIGFYSRERLVICMHEVISGTTNCMIQQKLSMQNYTWTQNLPDEPTSTVSPTSRPPLSPPPPTAFPTLSMTAKPSPSSAHPSIKIPSTWLATCSSSSIPENRRRAAVVLFSPRDRGTISTLSDVDIWDERGELA